MLATIFCLEHSGLIQLIWIPAVLILQQTDHCIPLLNSLSCFKKCTTRSCQFLWDVAADFKIDFPSQDVSCRSTAIAIEQNFSKEKLNPTACIVLGKGESGPPSGSETRKQIKEPNSVAQNK